MHRMFGNPGTEQSFMRRPRATLRCKTTLRIAPGVAWQDLSARIQKALKGKLFHKRDLIKRYQKGRITIEGIMAETGWQRRSARNLVTERSMRRLVESEARPDRQRLRSGRWPTLEKQLAAWVTSVNKLFHRYFTSLFIFFFKKKTDLELGPVPPSFGRRPRI